jgi:hypothetical protein
VLKGYQYFIDLTRGGVLGLGWAICAIFCYAGFNIWNEHIKF